MPGFRALSTSLAFTAISAAVVVGVSITPIAVAADATIEAESMTVTPRTGASVVKDTSASGGSALVLTAASTASTTIALPASASIVVRAKGQQCNGAPTMNLAVDGKTISTTKVSSTSWSSYTTPTTLAAGSHTIGIAYPNPYRFFCTRSLSLDRVTVVASAPSTTSTTPTTTSSNSQPPPSGDATAWLQSKFDALTAGQTLTLSPGTYQHSGVLQLRVAGTRIEGNGATLQATNDSTSAVQIVADNVSLSNLTLAAPASGQRYDALEQHKLVIQGNGVTVSDVTVNGSAAAGVFVYRATNFTINRVTVRNSRADGIHMTGGANNGQVNNAVTQSTGDDGIAVVSYGNETICHDITINSPIVNGTTWGRGISVVGGQNISYNNIAVSQTNAAGVYVASEGNPYNTLSASKVKITGGTVTGANTNPQIVHGAVLVYNGNSSQSTTDVTVSGLTISNTPTSAYRNVGIVVDGGSVSRIAFNNIAIQNTQAVPFAKSANVPAGSYTTSGWTLNGVPITVS